MARTSLGWRRVLAFTALCVLGVLSSDVLVDDADPRIVYSPSEHWSQGASCEKCSLHPNPSETQDGTWHDTTFEPGGETGPFSASFTFTGIGIKVYAVLPAYSANNLQIQTTHTDVNFLLDNVDQEAPFQYDPPVGSDFQYRQLIFDSGTVIHGDHTLTIHLSTDVLSVLLLDYLVYTVPDATTSSLVRPTDSVTAGDSTSTTSGTTTKSQGTQATSISTSSSSVEQTTPPSVQSTSTLSSHSTFSSSMSAAGSSAQSSGAGSPDVHSPSNTQSGLPSGNSALTSNLTPISTTSDAHAEPIATNESTGPPTNSIPATTVIAAAVGGSLAVLILLGAVIYLLCIRHARRHFATGGRNHAESPEDDDQPRFVELTQELYPSLATQARLLGHTRNPFADPGVQQSPHANMDTAEVSNLSRSIPANSAYSHAPPDDLESPPMSRSSIQGVITARTSSIISLSAPARPDSPPTTLVDHSHLGASDKLSVAGGTESDDDSGGPCSAPASTLSEVPLRPVPASVDTAPPLNALNHNSWLAADARVLEQLAALKDEVARIRARQEALPAEAPPRYDEVR